MLFKKLFVALLSVVILWSPVSWAKSLNFGIDRQYISIRALGMGNAFSAVADDHSAIFYNPAALARREDGNIHAYLIKGGGDPDYLELVDDIKAASDLPNEDDQIPAIQDVLEKNLGNTYYARLAALGGFWVRPNWGIAFLPADLTLNIQPTNIGVLSLDVDARIDSTLAFSYARDLKWFGKDHFSMGITVKAIHRISYQDVVLPVDLVVNPDPFNTDRAGEGMTIDADIGTLYTPAAWKDAWFSPTFALVVRNVGDYGFPINFGVIGKDSKEPEDSLQRTVDVGAKINVPNFWVFDPHFSFEIKDILHEKSTLTKSYHAGFEAYWKMFNWWKGHWAVGINQGHLTYGVGARLAWFQLDAVVWNEEVGTESVPKTSERYMVELSMDF